MNTPTKAGVALAVLALVWAGGTAVSGQRLQSALATTGPLGDAEDLGFIKVVNRQYDKSFLGATRTLQLQLGCAADGQTPMQVTWRDQIEHGPLPGFSSFGAARIRTQIELDAATRAELKARLGSEAFPADIVTTVGLTGSRSTTVTGHDIRLSDNKVGMQVALLGLKATIDTASGGDTQLHYELGSYSVADPRVRVEMAGLTGTMRGTPPHWYAMATEGQGTLKLMTVRLNTEAAANDKPLLQLKDLQVTQTGKTVNDLYTAEAVIKGSGEAGGHKLDAVSMKMAMKNLHAPTYAKLLNTFSAPFNDCSAPTAADPAAAMLARMKPMQDAMLAMLPHNPSVALEDLSVTFDGQTAKFNYSLGTQGITAEDIKNGFTPSMMSKFGFKARAEAPVAFMKSVAKAQNQAPELVDGMLAQGAATGMIQRKGDTVLLEAVFANGQLKLNGRPMPIPGFRGAAPQAPAEPEALPPAAQ